MREGAASSTGITSRRPSCRAGPNKPAPSAGSRRKRSRPSSLKAVRESPQCNDRDRGRTSHPTSCRPGRGPTGPTRHRTRRCKAPDQSGSEDTQRDRSAVAQDTIDPTPRSSRARNRAPQDSPPYPFREPRAAGRIDCAGAPLARRTHDQPAANTESIAAREDCSARKVNMTISLAFLAPDLVKAAIDGRLPHGMGVARLSDLPAEWSRQHQMLGLNTPNHPHSNRVSA